MVRPVWFLAVSCVGLGACVDDADPGAADEPSVVASARCGDQRHVRIAWLGNDPANTYDEANHTAAVRVADGDHSEVRAYYAGFDPATQLAQCHSALGHDHADALMVLAADASAILPCVDEARHRGVPVVAVDLPIGPDLATVQPQVPGQVGAVLVPPARWGTELAALVAGACSGDADCQVAYIAGAFGIALDDAALAELDALAASHPAIHIVARAEAFYDRATAAAVTADLVAAHPAIDLIVGAGDQMAAGAEDALPSPSQVKIVGAGAGAYGVTAVRAGRWYATFMALPADEGRLGADIAIRAARHQPIAVPGIDPVVRRHFPAFFTAANQGQFAGFVPQWPG